MGLVQAATVILPIPYQCLVRTGFVLFRRVSQLGPGHTKPLPRPGRMMAEPGQVKNIVYIYLVCRSSTSCDFDAPPSFPLDQQVWEKVWEKGYSPKYRLKRKYIL